MKAIAYGALLLLTGGVAAAEQDESSFCARLAPGAALKPTNHAHIWQGYLRSPLMGSLIGGTVMVGFRVEPVDPDEPDGAAALRDVCTVTKANVRCVIDRPMILTLTSNKGDAKVEARPGEKALVTTKGTRVRCTDGVTA